MDASIFFLTLFMEIWLKYVFTIRVSLASSALEMRGTSSDIQRLLQIQAFNIGVVNFTSKFDVLRRNNRYVYQIHKLISLFPSYLLLKKS